MRRLALFLAVVLMGIVVMCTECAATSCVATSDDTRLVVSSSVKALVDANRPVPSMVSTEALGAQLAGLLYDYDDFSNEAVIAQLLYNPTRTGATDDAPVQISNDQAVEEMELLFRILKYGYSGYQFFGGDEAFEAARDMILGRVGHDAGFTATEELLDLIVDGLHFVQDGHLVVGGRALCKRSLLYADYSREFVRTDSGEFVGTDGRTLVRAGGGSPSEYMKATINEAGDIVYIIGLLAPSDAPSLEVALEFADGSRQSVQLLPVFAEPPEVPDCPYELAELEGIPLAVCRLFWPVGDNTEPMNAFIRDAERLWYESVVILDLRSNLGGNDMFVRQWCLNLTLKNPGSPGAGVDLRTTTAASLMDSTRGLLGAGPRENPRRSPLDPNRPGWSVISLSGEVFATNRPLLIVLMDSYSASATERFIDSLRHMDNVVFIGTNTWGAYLTGNVGNFMLPYSRLMVSVPTQLQITADMPNIDGIGFPPDFWVASEYALERAAEFVRRHVVESSPSEPSL